MLLSQVGLGLKHSAAASFERELSLFKQTLGFYKDSIIYDRGSW